MLIIGGGVIGLSIADRLAREGLSVVVLERNLCGQESSWAGVGVISPCSWHRRDDLARLHMDSIFRYHEFAADLHERGGLDPEFVRCGSLKLIRDDNRMKMAVNEVKAVGGRKTPEGRPIVTTLTPVQTVALEPSLAVEIMGAQHCRMTAQVRNPRLLAALVECCRRGGVEIREGVGVKSLLKDGERVIGVGTELGEVRGGTTILCAGAWSAELDPLLARAVPVYPVRGQIMLLHMDAPPFQRIIEEDKFHMVVRADGHILIGTTEEHDSGFSKRTTAKAISALSQKAIEFVPALAGATLMRTWAGLRPGTPDRRAIVGFVPGLTNFISATGHFRTGLATAPVMADIVADLLGKGTCEYDLAKCAPGRNFPDRGSQ